MDHRIIKYYAGELSKEERKALLQEAFSNQELKKEMINCQHLQSLVKLHPQEKNELSGKESLKRFMKARQIEKKKRYPEGCRCGRTVGKVWPDLKIVGVQYEGI